jgi:6,7-dimethyl-8-ribityllumazine synthase
MSGTVDAIITTGVLIKGDTMHFEYICDATSKAIMNVGIQTNVPIVFGVLTCLNEEQVKKRSSGDNNHGYDWGKTAVEMALLRADAIGAATKPTGMGFGAVTPLSDNKGSKGQPARREKGPGFF